MKHSLSILLVVIVMTASAFQAVARPGLGGGFGPEMGGFGHLDMIADHIGLTEEQEAKINELINSAELATAVDRERMQQIREELRGLSESGESFDETTALALADELGQIVSRTTASGAQVRWQVRQVFTAEQQQQLEEMKSQRFERMRARMGGGI